jgi:hypothetical protein
MSRKKITSDVEAQLGDCPADIGPAIGLVADVLNTLWHENHGQYLDKDERKAHGKKPLAFVEETDIEIRTHGKVLKIERDNQNKPSVSIPMGLSDKITTATIPHTWIESILLQTLISGFGGDTSYAEKIVGKINGWIDDATIETDDGRLKIDQTKLPQPKNAVVVAEMLDSMKRTFKSKSKGTTQLNLTLSVLDADDIQPTSMTMLDDRDIIAIPDIDTQEINEASHTFSISANMDNSEKHTISGMRDEGMGVVLSPPTLEATDVAVSREELSQALIDVIGIEGRTIGYIGKNMASDKETWKPRLEALVESGILRKEGVRRSCRYYLGNLQ